MESELVIVNNTPVFVDQHFSLTTRDLKECIGMVNHKFRLLKDRTEKMSLNIFQVIDFRMLSGLVGELLVTNISESISHLYKNPNIDGYPDLLNCSTVDKKEIVDHWKKTDPSKFILFPFGGIEVKNTFGTKKSGVKIPHAKSRVSHIQGRLQWKAHHQSTNHLLALFSDFIDDCPQIVAAFYSENLEESDWTEKQQPKEGSAMTSFSVTRPSGWRKLRDGIRICNGRREYLDYLGV